MSLLNSLKTFCLDHPANTYWIAYSGGLDSHVLLSLMANVRQLLNINVKAIHIHHGLSKNADAWLIHCVHMCEVLGIDLITRKVSLDTTDGASLEEAARHARYAVFAEYIQTGDMLFTAHQQDDQAETFLLQLLRGAGVKGLSAMPIIKPFAQGYHARPLLHSSRQTLTQYAKIEKLVWIEDESNENKKFLRNFIRHDLLPLIQQREPAVIELISRSATHCAEAQALLEEFANQDEQQCAGSIPHTISVKHLQHLSPARQRLLLRSWINKCGFRLPDHRRLESIRHDVLTAKWDRMPCVRWGEVELRRYGDDLFLMSSLQAIDDSFVSAWDGITPLVIRGVGTLQTVKQKGSGLKPGINHIVVKLRTGGEVVAIPHRGTKSLKNLFQEWRVPTWQRERIPLLYVNDRLVGMVGYFLHPDVSVSGEEVGYVCTVV